MNTLAFEKTKTDPVYRAFKAAWYSYNGNRRRAGEPEITLEEYLERKMSGDLVQGRNKLATGKRFKRAAVQAQLGEELRPQWEAENAKRAKRGQLPLKYEDFCREWRDWL